MNKSRESHPQYKKLPPDIEQAILQAYLAGATMEEAVAPHGYTVSACRKALKRAGLKSRKKYISEADKEGMVAAYAEGLTLEAAAARFGHCHDACRMALKERGIDRRAAKYRDYSLDERFFEAIDSESKAYILGFLATDGYVDDTTGGVTIALARADRGHLLKLRDTMGSNAPIRDGTHQTTGTVCEHSELRLFSRDIVRDLAALGIHRAKSHTVKPWAGPENLMRHYWRGAVDGDGCLTTGSYGRGWIIEFCGNRHMVSAFAEFAARITGEAKMVKPNASIFFVRYGRFRHVQQIAKALYDGATLYLDRKRKLADKILATRRQTVDWSWLTAEALMGWFRQYGSWKRVSDSIPIDWPTLWKHRKRCGVTINAFSNFSE